MAKPFNFGEIKLTVGGDGTSAIPDPETPFCVALIGDFSGRVNRGICESASIASRRLTLVDRDNFDEVFRKLGAEIHLPLGKSGTSRFGFAELDDFHPDRIFERAPIFERLREVRTRLNDPATFAETAEELGLVYNRTATSGRSQPELSRPPAASVPRLASGSLLDEMIEQSEAHPSDDQPRRADELQEFVRRVTEPHLVAAADPRQAEAIAVIDRATGLQMRALLHTRDFQALEAAWRAVFLLVRRIETGSQLKLYLIDISKAELAKDLASASDLRETGAYRLFVERSVGASGAEPWTVIAGNYNFEAGGEDFELLARLAKVASAAGAAFVAGASPRLLGLQSFSTPPEARDWRGMRDADTAEAWAALRGLPEAKSVGLALPRFLLRLPYGRKTAPVEAFDFEEMPDGPSPEDYLWGNAAFACALLLAQSFAESGWEMGSNLISEIDDLPLHAYEYNGESGLQPCAETLMTDELAERILQNGLMPLASLKGKDAVRLVRFQSVAEPLRRLAGRWS
jgi:type VI secretion system protein ImpC